MNESLYINSAIKCICFADHQNPVSNKITYAVDLFNEWCEKESRLILQINVQTHHDKYASFSPINQILVFYLLSKEEKEARQKAREKKQEEAEH